MRDRYFYLLFFAATALWFVLMTLGPKRTAEESVFLVPGMIFLLMGIFMWIAYLEGFQRTHNAVAPGFRTTLWNPMPYKSVKIANFKNPGLREFNIYKLGGTHWGPIEGGGKDGGYAVIPADLDYLFPGERSQRVWNVAYRWHRENPDPARGELDLMYLPTPIYKVLKDIDGWHDKAPVMFGWFPYFRFHGQVKNRDMLEYVQYLEKKDKKRDSQIDDLLSATSSYAKVAKYTADAFGPNERRAAEKKSLLDKFRREEEGE